MPRGKPFARIAITLPQVDLEAADRLAAISDRSRSWIVAEALRCYVASRTPLTAGAALGASRHEQLRRDLALTPLERIRAAEEGVHMVGLPAGEDRGTEPLRFSTFDDFLTWRRLRPASE
jgi:hypothetical protein